MTLYIYYTLKWQVIPLILIIAFGCASAKPIEGVVKPADRGREKKDATIDDLLRLLDSRYDEIDAIKALINIEVDSIPPVALKSFDGELTYGRPRNLRIRGFDPLFPRPIFDFIARGEDFQFRSGKNGRILEGNINEFISTSSIEGPIKFTDLLDVIGAVGTPFIDPSLVTVLEKNDEFFILYTIVMHGERGKLEKKIWIDRIDSQIRKEEIFDITGSKRMIISFDDYRSIEGIIRPYLISAEREGLKINLRIREIKINPKLDLEDFNLKGVNGA